MPENLEGGIASPPPEKRLESARKDAARRELAQRELDARTREAARQEGQAWPVPQLPEDAW